VVLNTSMDSTFNHTTNYQPHALKEITNVMDMLELVNKHSKKRNLFSLSTAFIFSKLNMCKYLYEHNKIQQLRQKLNNSQKCD
jgi:hypothetical protein